MFGMGDLGMARVVDCERGAKGIHEMITEVRTDDTVYPYNVTQKMIKNKIRVEAGVKAVQF